MSGRTAGRNSGHSRTAVQSGGFVMAGKTSTISERKAGGHNSHVTTKLRVFVADTLALTLKTQAFHWNMTGSNFIGLHKLTEEQYGELFQATDDLAERLRALKCSAPVGLGDIHATTSIDDAPQSPDTETAVKVLEEDHVAMASRAKDIALAADESEDVVTHDMLVKRMEYHQKSAWLLRSHVS